MQAKIWNYSTWIWETTPSNIKYFFQYALVKSGFNVLNVLEYNFEPQGYTALWLLGESHFAVHTFPESKKSYIELSSCNLKYYERFIELTKNL